MGKNLFAPMQKANKAKTYSPRKRETNSGGYTLDELSDLYSRCRGAENELDVLADFACLPHDSLAVKKLRKEIQEHIKQKYQEVRQ